jgi:hypothetical protein
VNKGFGGKARKKETIIRTRRRWANNIKMHVKEIKWGGINWIHLAEGRDQ